MSSHGCWVLLDLKQKQHPRLFQQLTFCIKRTWFFFSPFFDKTFLHRMSCSPCGFSICGPCIAIRQVLLSALFFLMILNYIAHVEIINFKPCQNHFPHTHGIHSFPSSMLTLSLLRRIHSALCVPMKQSNPVLFSLNQTHHVALL